MERLEDTYIYPKNPDIMEHRMLVPFNSLVVLNRQG